MVLWSRLGPPFLQLVPCVFQVSLTWPALSDCWWPPSEVESRSLCLAAWHHTLRPPAPCSVPGCRTWQITRRKGIFTLKFTGSVFKILLQSHLNALSSYLIERATELYCSFFFICTDQILEYYIYCKLKTSSLTSVPHKYVNLITLSE